MKQWSCCLFFLLLAGGAAAQPGNPIVPAGTYLADPAGHQWSDGKMYLYVSRDENPGYYCSWNYDVLSSPDMLDWTIHRDTFASRGENDAVPYSDGMLYAPDCMYKDGTYYLYYCMSGGGEDEGVATAHSPVGPFTNGRRIEGISQIDPCVFIDDDGQAYIYWGQFSAKGARLLPNMKEVELSSMRDSLITEEQHFFHEGIQMIKREGIYYLIYAHIGRRGMATCIGYATGDSPLGPFRYRGVIVDNFGSDPNAWNNHGSIARFNDQWYVFYHRPTHGSVTMRKACAEPIRFNPDGTIDEVEMTTQGAASPLNPYALTDAARACYLTGNVRISRTPENPMNEELSGIGNLNTAAYKYFDFPRSPKKFTVHVTPQTGGKIQVFANNLCGPLLTTIEVPPGDGHTPVRLSGEIRTSLTGVCPVYFRFSGEGISDLFRVDGFQFE